LPKHEKSRARDQIIELIDIKWMALGANNLVQYGGDVSFYCFANEYIEDSSHSANFKIKARY